MRNSVATGVLAVLHVVFEGEICEAPDGLGENVGKTSIYRVQKQEINSNVKRIRREADD